MHESLKNPQPTNIQPSLVFTFQIGLRFIVPAACLLAIITEHPLHLHPSAPQRVNCQRSNRASRDRWFCQIPIEMDTELKSPYWSVNWASACTSYRHNHIDVLASCGKCIHPSVTRTSVYDGFWQQQPQNSASHSVIVANVTVLSVEQNMSMSYKVLSHYHKFCKF